MTIEDAAHLVTIDRAQRDIMADPSLSLSERVRTLGAIQNAAQLSQAPQPWLTMGDVVKGAVGAGLGAGAGVVLGKVLGVSPDTLSTFRNLGMGFGTLLNMGKIAMDTKIVDKLVMRKQAMAEQDRRNAIRYAFTKTAMELGLFQLLQLPVFQKAAKTASANFVTALPLTPELLTAPISAGMNLGSNLASNAGALAGSLSAPDATDEKMTRMLLARRALEGQAGDLTANRKQMLLKRILARRTAA